jgi:hypothetical protein
MRFVWALSLLFLVAATTAVNAEQRFVTGGQTSVLLDTATLSSVGLDLSGVSPDVILPGELGMDSVAFGIDPRTGTNPTTFAYELFSLAPFSGTIEHSGSVFFNMDTIEVGDFSIGFDAGRVTAVNSGFFVESTTGLTGILFDVEAPSALNAGAFELTIAANLLVSPEFAGILGNAGLAGVDVGDAFVRATAVPEPAGFSALAALGIAMCVRRRK